MKERPISNLPFDSVFIHGSTSDDLEEFAAAFALEALTVEERADYLIHLERCIFCTNLVGQFQAVTELLPESLEQQTVSVAVKDRILAEARADIEIAPTSQPFNVEQSRSIKRSWLTSWLSPGPSFAIAALVVVVTGLVVWNLSLQQSLNELTGTQNQQGNLINAIAIGADVSPLQGTEFAPDSRARVVHTPGSLRAFLVVHNLNSLSPDKEYQVWRISADGPVGVGTFNTLDAPVDLIPLAADFSDADAIGVSIEPKGGSPAPTGDIVLLGETN